MEDKVLLIGSTPAVYMCAIYTFTANIPVTVLHQESHLEYIRGELPGLPDISKEQFAQNCREQAENMGISVTDTESVKLENIDGKIVVIADGVKHEPCFVVMDILPEGVTEADNLYSIAERIPCKDAIAVAATGCKISFKIKEKLGH